MTDQPKKTRLTDRKRESILAAAVKVFQENGFDRAKVDQIAAVASVSKRTLYNHFASKEELFLAIVIEMKNQIGQLNEFPFCESTPIEEQIKGICRQLVAMFVAEDFLGLARVIVSRFLQKPELAKQAFQDEPVCHGALVGWMECAMQSSKLAIPDTDLAAKILMGLVKELFFWPTLIADEAISDKKTEEQFIEEVAKVFVSRYACKS